MLNKIIACVTGVLICCTLSACSVIEEPSSAPELKYETQYPPTAMEYNLAINKKIVPVMNLLEGHCSKGKDIIANNYPKENELVSVEDSITEVEEIFDLMKLIFPPDSEKQSHSDTLMQVEQAINSLKVYKEGLENENYDSVLLQSCIDIMMSEAIIFSPYFSINHCTNAVLSSLLKPAKILYLKS